MSTASDALARLRDRTWSLGIAESLTGGSLAAEIVSVPGASSTLWGAVVAYATPVKHTLLGVDADLLAEHGPVHPDVALQMAAGARLAVQVDGRPADVGVSTTGVAGPGSPDGQPVGTVYIGVVTPTESVSESFAFVGDRSQIRIQAVEAALSMLVRIIEE